jgi:hypothetical protein
VTCVTIPVFAFLPIAPRHYTLFPTEKKVQLPYTLEVKHAPDIFDDIPVKEAKDIYELARTAKTYETGH